MVDQVFALQQKKSLCILIFGASQEAGEHFFPCWFKLRSLTSQQQQGADHWLGSALVRLPDQEPPGMWEFTGSYWEAKQMTEWSQSPDIYSGGPEADEPLPSPAVTV